MIMAGAAVCPQHAADTRRRALCFAGRRVATLTNAHAVSLIVYEWPWWLESNVVRMGLYGWQGECTRRANRWRGVALFAAGEGGFHETQLDAFLWHVANVTPPGDSAGR